MLGITNTGGFGVEPGDKLLFNEIGAVTPTRQEVNSTTNKRKYLRLYHEDDEFLYAFWLIDFNLHLTKVNKKTLEVENTIEVNKIGDTTYPSPPYIFNRNKLFIVENKGSSCNVKRYSENWDVELDKEVFELNVKKKPGEPGHAHIKHSISLTVINGRYFIAFYEDSRGYNDNKTIIIREYDEYFNRIIREYDTKIIPRTTDFGAITKQIILMSGVDYLTLFYQDNAEVDILKCYDVDNFEEIATKQTNYTVDYREVKMLSQKPTFVHFSDSVIPGESTRTLKEISKNGSIVTPKILDLTNNFSGKFIGTGSLVYLNSEGKKVYQLGTDSNTTIAAGVYNETLHTMQYDGLFKYELMGTMPEFDIRPWWMR